MLVEHCVFCCLSAPNLSLRNMPKLHRPPFSPSVLNVERMSAALRRFPPEPPPPPAVPCTVLIWICGTSAVLTGSSRRSSALQRALPSPTCPQLLARSNVRWRQKRGSRRRLSTRDKTQQSRHKSGDKGTEPAELSGIAKCGQPQRPWPGMMTLISASACSRRSD